MFHPTFLYESLWNFALCGLLILIDRRYRPAGGRLLAMYVLGYGVGRFWVEGLRIDAADHLGGLRWNQWVAIACIVGGGLYLLATIHKPKDPILPPIVHGEPHPAVAEADADAGADTVPTTDAGRRRRGRRRGGRGRRRRRRGRGARRRPADGR